MTDIRGFVERVTREGVRGWAYDAADPARAQLIEVLVDGRAVAIGTTDQPRGDFVHLNLGRDTLGFAVSLPDGMAIELHRLEVRIAGSSDPLPMSEDAGAYEGFVEVFHGGSIKGWAWHCGYPEERVRIIVRHRGEVVGSSLANQLRPDLITSGVGDGRHAFLIALPMVQKRLDPAHLYAEFEANGAPLIDLRYPDRAPPPAPVATAPDAPHAPEPAPVRAAPRPTSPVKTPIAARPPMSRMPMARSTKPPVPAAPAVAARPIAKRVIPTPTVSAPPSAQPSVGPSPVQQAPPPAKVAPEPVPEPVAVPAPTPAPVAVVPPAPPTPAISKEVYEALRGALSFGEEDGLF